MIKKKKQRKQTKAEKDSDKKKLEALTAAFGMWKDRTDIPDLRELRKSRDFFAEDGEE